jgi:hypothetical protein
MQQIKILSNEFSPGVHKYTMKTSNPTKYTIYSSNNRLNGSGTWILKKEDPIRRDMAFQGKKPVGRKISFDNANEIDNKIVSTKIYTE